ncbi:carboxylesterase [Actinomyces sp. 2119]|uniref:carboxylesterase/lipase family protein n=1 Tax=Actinomyces sp. 2119 TaxID=2321393 RepID=UPI000E6C4C0E|nr:carboxylesterase family protein [Actinomyces sp. 2119]RJF43869.1 carboxylesterase [Actinomyces sp. 2119]
MSDRTTTDTTLSAEHVSSTPIAVPVAGSGPLVRAPCGPVRGRWRTIVPPGTLADAPATTPVCRAPDLTRQLTGYGRSAAFYNIPYAEAPVGRFRFMAPVPRARWQEERAALLPGPTPQRGSVFEDPAIPEPSVPGEDMLNLNVFTPVPGQAKAGLPVYVWIHGGGWSSGCQASPWYDGAAFNRDGVVTVVPSYRLGFDGYGWVDGSDAPLNRGVLDQVLALEWVRDNIAAFGGDPTNVTVGGQSAGGGNVLTLMTAPRAEGLFCRGIIESAAVTDIPADWARDTARQMAELAGVTPTLEGWHTLDYDQLFATTMDFEAHRTELAATHAPPLAHRVRAALVPGEDTTITYGPTVDGDVLSLGVHEAIARGHSAAVPLLAISTTHEFLTATSELADEMEGRSAAEVLTEAGLDAGLARDYVAGHPEHTDRQHLLLGNVLSDAMFHLPLVAWAEARRCHRSTHDSNAGTWISRFAWESPATGWSTHCFEVPFAFDCLAHPYCDHTLQGRPPQSLADAVHGDWVRFITTGDPGWTAWDERGLGRAYGDPRGPRPDGTADGEVYRLQRRLLAAGRSLRRQDTTQGRSPQD